MALVGAAGRLGISAKAREVRGVHRVVIRDGEAISAMLALMGATDTVAQLGGAAPAPRGARHGEPPRQLRRRQPPPLGAGRRRRVRPRRARAWRSSATTSPTTCKYAGELRLAHRDASLDELGHHADPPMTKDAVAGRIRRLLAMADKQAADLGVPGHRGEPARRPRRRLSRRRPAAPQRATRRAARQRHVIRVEAGSSTGRRRPPGIDSNTSRPADSAGSPRRTDRGEAHG